MTPKTTNKHNNFLKHIIQKIYIIFIYYFTTRPRIVFLVRVYYFIINKGIYTKIIKVKTIYYFYKQNHLNIIYCFII